MTSKTLLEVGIFALCIGLFGCERQISFADDVQPILFERCIECHDQAGEGIVSSGFSVRDYDSVMSGTKFGPVVVPESSMSSALYLVVSGKTDPQIRMPPHHDDALAEGRGTPLTDNHIEIIRTWIDQGAQNN